MAAAKGRRRLQGFLAGLGVVPIATGSAVLLFGSAAIPDGGVASPSLESELRLYSVWWIGGGVFLLTLIGRIERAEKELRAVCALLVLGGIGRSLAIVTEGWPHPIFVGTTALEFTVPPVLLIWQARIARSYVATVSVPSSSEIATSSE
jgi:hypothetical protein